jgi:hypothetical protein
LLNSDGVEVDGAIKAVMLMLINSPLAKGTQKISQMYVSGGLNT